MSKEILYKKITRREVLSGGLQLLGGFLTVGYVVRNEGINRAQDNELIRQVRKDWAQDYLMREVEFTSVDRDLAVLDALNRTRRELGLEPFVIAPTGEIVRESEFSK